VLVRRMLVPEVQHRLQGSAKRGDHSLRTRQFPLYPRQFVLEKGDEVLGVGGSQDPSS